MLSPFEHAATAETCADCEGTDRCARHDKNPRCVTHGDYLAEGGSCATCLAEAIHGGGCDARCGGTWTCPGCERFLGYCMGCSDDMPELCDDCWADVTKAREFARREAS